MDDSRSQMPADELGGPTIQDDDATITDSPAAQRKRRMSGAPPVPDLHELEPFDPDAPPRPSEPVHTPPTASLDEAVAPRSMSPTGYPLFESGAVSAPASTSASASASGSADASASAVASRSRTHRSTSSHAPARSHAGGQPSVREDTVSRAFSSRQALFSEGVDRMRVFSTLVGGLCVIVCLAVPFLGGNSALQWIVWGGAFFSIFSSVWVVVTLKEESRYDQRFINLGIVLSVFIACAGVLYIGINSPVAMIATPGVYFIARGQQRAPAYLMYLTYAITLIVLSLLVISGTMEDPGLITAPHVEPFVLGTTQFLVQLMLLGTFILARSSRQGTLVAMNKLIEAEQKAQEREAAFIEVREDLDRVLGAGGFGHHSNRVLGKYKLGGLIGRGAMGEVYEAVHIETGQLAAAKVLHPHVLAKPSSVERFLREAEAASRIRSRHVVHVLESSGPEAPMPYLIMERLSGNDLAHHLREVRRMTVEEVVPLIRDVATVVDQAAEQGVVHRDIKPQNLFLAEDNSGKVWKVLDFGASKLAEHSGTLTQGRVVGTPAYMSPQQAKGQDVDSAADRYCLAAIAYRCLVGRPPFTGKDLPTTLFNVVYGTPPQPSIMCDVPIEVDYVLAIGMAKEPQSRFTTALQFAEALDQAGKGKLEPQLVHHAKALLAKNPWGMLPNKGS